MIARTMATALVATATVAGWGGEAGAQHAAARVPDTGRFADPLMGVYAWPSGTTRQDVLLYYLSSQYRQSKLAREQMQPPAAGAATAASSPYYRMRPGGPVAAGYFGRTQVIDPTAGPPSPSRYNRLGPYFGPRGR